MTDPTDLQPWDEVRVLGWSANGKHYYKGLTGTVDVVNLKDKTMKVWPDDGRDGGKIWIDLDRATVELVRREPGFMTGAWWFDGIEWRTAK